MKASVLLCLLTGVLIFVSTSNARPNTIKPDHSTFDEEIEKDFGFARSHGEFNRRGRKVRHSRQLNEGYGNQPFGYYGTYRNRLDTNELFFKQIEIIEQLLDYLKTMRSNSASNPPQPIYIPYPVYIPVPSIQCSKGAQNNISFDGRGDFPKDLVWGREPESNNILVGDDDDDGARPISLTPNNLNRPEAIPSPSVEHGSFQSGNPTTAAPITTTTPKALAQEPGICEAAIISCCRFEGQEQKACFDEYGCTKTFLTGVACSPKTIQIVMQHFIDAYAPKRS